METLMEKRAAAAKGILGKLTREGGELIGNLRAGFHGGAPSDVRKEFRGAAMKNLKNIGKNPLTIGAGGLAAGAAGTSMVGGMNKKSSDVYEAVYAQALLNELEKMAGKSNVFQQLGHSVAEAVQNLRAGVHHGATKEIRKEFRQQALKDISSAAKNPLGAAIIGTGVGVGGVSTAQAISGRNK